MSNPEKIVVPAINSYEEFQAIINSDKVVVIDFWATWCGPCKMISPVFEKLASDPAFGSIAFYKVDVDTQPQIAQQVAVRSMPTFIAFKAGKKIEQVVGARPDQLQNLLKQVATE